MTMNIHILFFLIFSSLVTADNISSESILVTGQVFIIIGIIIGSIFVVIGLISFLYFILKCVKRRISEPQYYIDETPTTKDSSESNGGINDIHYQVQPSNRIQPSLSIRHNAVSIKQSLIDLRDSLIPFSWSQAQQHIHHPESPINEKMDLPI